MRSCGEMKGRIPCKEPGPVGVRRGLALRPWRRFLRLRSLPTLGYLAGHLLAFLEGARAVFITTDAPLRSRNSNLARSLWGASSHCHECGVPFESGTFVLYCPDRSEE
jgi:hypothetical protein